MSEEAIATTTAEVEARKQRDVLKTRLDDVNRKIVQLIEGAEHGDLESAPRFNELSVTRLDLRRQLKEAEEQLATAHANKARAAEQRRKERLGAVLSELQDIRRVVVEHVRTAAVALGRFEHLRKEAVPLLNAANALGTGGSWLHERTRLTEAERLITTDEIFSGEWMSCHKPVMIEQLLDYPPRVRPVHKL